MREKTIKVTPLYYDYVLDNDYQIVIQVGGRFSGKSHNEQIRLASNLVTKRDYKLLVIENLESGMADGFYSGIRDRITEFEQDEIYNPRSRTAFIKNTANGNEVIFRGYTSEIQKLNVKRISSVTEIIVEEGEWIDYSDFTALQHQLRGGNPDDRKLTILMNPVIPDCFVNHEFIMKPPTKVYEYFSGTDRPKVFERDITTTFNYEGEEIETTSTVLVVLSTHFDNPFLTNEQRATIEELRKTDPDKYKQLGEARFIQPKGALLNVRNYFSLSRFDINQAGQLIGVVDTASSGSDSATLGIYAVVDEEHHYLIDVIKDDGDAKRVIPRMVMMLNKYRPQRVMIEQNHEGLYYQSKIKEGIDKGIMVGKFFSSENKHEKILGQSGRMVEHFYVRDDAKQEYNEFVSEMYAYNKDKRLNVHDDCIDNVAMYFKHCTTKKLQTMNKSILGL